MTTSQFNKMRLELRRGALVLAVLSSLNTPHYGYSLRKQLQQAGIDVEEGTLYPLIRRLADQQLLDSQWRHTEGRERRYYQLSNDGKALLEQLSTEWQGLTQSVNALLAENMQ
ncbi:PadR family transcriptional regulator [Lacimicrobium sp. SS2-24]|uniref:PadR family transcriptional regulator n=1 Tax=Lacimicrobium sp. SS2-24 TaxID=2005569 RepID=UPI000B4B86FA|nr:PadR family transcriptional regulator [Lacimicrobium sp. SS2-24]